MARWNVIALAVVLGAALALPASAQWKWRDKSGRTQYSDLAPPPGTPEQDILQRPNAAGGTTPRPTQTAAPGMAPIASAASVASAPPLLAPGGSEPELEARRKKAEQDVADKKKADEAKIAADRAENCNRARTQVRTLESGVRITRVKENGEREFMDDAARAAEMARARGIAASDCK